jgi:hypothetical protein
MLMRCKAFAEGCRALLATTAFYHDMAHISEGAVKDKFEGLVELLVPICKAYSSDWAYDVTENAIQVYGGYGYCSEYPVEQYARDTKITSIYEGTNGIQALDLLGRKLTMKGGMLFMYYMQDLAGFCNANKKHEVMGKYVEKLQKAQETLAMTVMGMPAFMKKPTFNEKIVPVLLARPFLDMFGHIVLSHLHISMALKASELLTKLYAEKGADGDPEKRAKVVQDNDEAKFLHNKIQTAIWFVNNILPEAQVVAEYFKIADTSALDVVF